MRFCHNMLLGIVLSSLSGMSIAGGVPVIDGLSAENDAIDYAVQLESQKNLIDTLENRIQSYSTQLEQYAQQVKQYEQQLRDSYKSVSDLTGSVGELYQSGKQVYNTVDNALTNAGNVVSYVEQNFGNADYWKKCASQGCDPTAIVDKSVSAVSNAATNSLGAVASAMKTTDNLVDKSKTGASNLSAEKGINGSIQNLAQLQMIQNQQQAELTRLMIMNHEMQANLIKAEETKRKADAQALANYVNNSNYKIEDHSDYSLTD